MKLKPNLKHIPVLFTIITVIAYGLMLPYTGFYWDDWPFAWIAKFLGPAEFTPAFLPFRPFLGPIFQLTTSLIPPVPIYWQVFALLIRLLLGLSAWWMFRQIWPERPRTAFFASLLLLVFPGYSQHWVAYTHINQELIPFIFFTLSFGFTFKAMRAEKPLPFMIIALLLEICGIFPTEYFFGLEGFRFMFLFASLHGSVWERAHKTFKIWTPYLFVWLLNAAWLVYYYRFGPYNSYEIKAATSISLTPFLFEGLDAIWKAGLYVWIQVLPLTSASITAPASLLTIGLILLCMALLTPYLLQLNLKETQNRAFSSSLILIGIFGILLGRLPSMAAGLPLTLQSSYDRFMISMMIGGTLLLLGLTELIFKNTRHATIFLAAVTALAIGQQFFNANIFRRDWQKQGEIYWQMAWRMPGIEPNVTLLTHQMPIDYETDLSFTAPINWMYAPEFTRSNLPYIFLYTEKRIGGGTLPALKPGIEITYPYRTVDFNGSTSRAVVIYMPQNGCLRVLDPQRGDEEIYSRQPDVLVKAIPLSNPALIIPNPQEPARPPFFKEPEHGWCYYFAKTELALQQKDYPAAAGLAANALQLGLAPEDPTEWLLFVEAFAMGGDMQKARDISLNILNADAKQRKGLCAVWKQIQAAGPVGGAQESGQFMGILGCNQ